MSATKKASAELSMVTLDCADPQALAEFYSSVTGWPVVSKDADAASLDAGPVTFALQRVDGYEGPGWPDLAKHAHVDLAVSDVEATVRAFEQHGGTRPEFQPGEGDWIVMQDPEGHPFCISAAS